MTFTGEQAATSAKRKDAARVFLGLPCLRGHRGWRYLSNKVCVDCARIHDDRRKFQPAATEQIIPDSVAPRITMHVSPWYSDIADPPGVMTRTVSAK